MEQSAKEQIKKTHESRTISGKKQETRNTADRSQKVNTHRVKEYQTIEHGFGPVYDSNSRILILGSFPSVKSREMQFFYGHPQNRFWKVLSILLSEQLPVSIEQKKEMLLRNHIALWDVIARCDIIGSSDSSIRNVIVNEIPDLLHKTKVDRIYVNGKTAKKLYDQYLASQTQIEAVVLPSTSPANAAFSVERLCEDWKQIVSSL